MPIFDGILAAVSFSLVAIRMIDNVSIWNAGLQVGPHRNLRVQMYSTEKKNYLRFSWILAGIRFSLLPPMSLTDHRFFTATERNGSIRSFWFGDEKTGPRVLNFVRALTFPDLQVSQEPPIKSLKKREILAFVRLVGLSFRFENWKFSSSAAGWRGKYWFYIAFQKDIPIFNWVWEKYSLYLRRHGYVDTGILLRYVEHVVNQREHQARIRIQVRLQNLLESPIGSDILIKKFSSE